MFSFLSSCSLSSGRSRFSADRKRTKMFEVVNDVAFWVMIVAFGAMVIVRWAQGSLGGALLFTVVVTVALGATLYREFYLALPNAWWKPAANLGAVLLNIVLLVATFLVFVATKPREIG